MRTTILILSAVALAACARDGDDMAADSLAYGDSPAAATSMTPLSHADLAGTWSLQFMGDMSDSVIATYDLTATTDATGWRLSAPGNDSIPVRVAVDGDSVMIDAGPYRMQGRTSDITTHAVGRLEGGMLVGTFVSQHAVSAADSVVRGRMRGTRTP